MAATLLLFCLLLVTPVTPQFLTYYGGTSSYRCEGRSPDGSWEVVFRNRATFDGCDHPDWGCRSGNCGHVVSVNQMTTIDSSRNAPYHSGQWCESETVTVRNVPSDKPFSLRVPQNCPRTYQLVPFDPDGDHVRCRYGNLLDVECTACNQYSGFQLDQDSCTLHYRHTTVDTKVHTFEMVVEDFPQAPLTLRYTDGSRSTRFPPHLRRWPSTTARPITNPLPWWWFSHHIKTTPTPTTAAPWRPPHAFGPTRSWNRWWNLQYTTAQPTTTNNRRGNTQPLSNVPLQFSVLVDPPVHYCQEGAYIPRLLPPTPENGARIQAELDRVLEITVKAQSSYSSLNDIIFSGPQGMTKNQTTHQEFVLKWRPTSAELRVKAPLCFAVESRASSRVYQSEMRCVIIEAQRDAVRSKVSCGQSTMTIAIEKASFPGLREDQLRLTDPSNVVCSFHAHSNNTHFVASFPLNACGTQIEEKSEKLTFKNEVTTVGKTTGMIIRKNLLELDFVCEYPKHGNVTLGFKTHRKNVTVWEKGFGTFTYGFEFYDDSSYSSMISPSSYPLECNMGSRIYMEIRASSSVNNTELFVESCRASPYDNPNSRPTYSIIENGCTLDQTVAVHSPAHTNKFRFSMEAFKFIGLHDQVFISCSVVICEQGRWNTLCARGCIHPRLQRDHRSKREVSVQTANHLISQGPLRLRRSAEGATSTDVSLNLNLVFIVGALLAAVAMISTASYLIKRISHVKYQPLLTSET